MATLVTRRPTALAATIFMLLLTVSLAHGQGTLCDVDYDCAPHGSCGSDLICLCDAGYTGPQCDVVCPLDCQNGARCIMDNEHELLEEGSFHCECPSTHDGGLCHIPVQGSSPKTSSKSTGRNVGIATGVILVFSVLVLGAVRWIRRKRRSPAKAEAGEAEDITEPSKPELEFSVDENNDVADDDLPSVA